MKHHVIRRGETLAALASRYDTSLRVLARLNEISDPARVAIGRRVVVPSPRDSRTAIAMIAVQPDGGKSGVQSRTDVVAPSPVAEPQKMIRCTGPAYVLKGNDRLVGKEGFPGTKVKSGSAAIIPRQFTGQLTAGPKMRAIGKGATGTITSADGKKSQTINTFTDSVAEASMGTTEQAQDKIMARDPGAIVFEIVGGEHYGAGAKYDITIPDVNGCPIGAVKK